MGCYLSCQNGPFKTKLLPNRVHGNIQQPNWPLPEAFKTTKKAVEFGSQNILLPERALRRLSRRASPKRNCCQTGPSANIELPRRVLTTEADLSPTEAHYQDGALPKINCCRNGSSNDIQLSERASTETIKAGPIRKETAANWHTAGSNYRSGTLLRLSRRIPSKKETASKAGPRQYPTTGAGPT